jgi:hypothetical protein
LEFLYLYCKLSIQKNINIAAFSNKTQAVQNHLYTFSSFHTAPHLIPSNALLSLLQQGKQSIRGDEMGSGVDGER